MSCWLRVRTVLVIQGGPTVQKKWVQRVFYNSSFNITNIYFRSTWWSGSWPYWWFIIFFKINDNSLNAIRDIFRLLAVHGSTIPQTHQHFSILVMNKYGYVIIWKKKINKSHNCAPTFCPKTRGVSLLLAVLCMLLRAFFKQSNVHILVREGLVRHTNRCAGLQYRYIIYSTNNAILTSWRLCCLDSHKLFLGPNFFAVWWCLHFESCIESWLLHSAKYWMSDKNAEHKYNGTEI